MQNQFPMNGSIVRFKREDDEEWREGEFDEQNQMFIEIYSSEMITHNFSDIVSWKYTEEPGD